MACPMRFVLLALSVAVAIAISLICREKADISVALREPEEKRLGQVRPADALLIRTPVARL